MSNRVTVEVEDYNGNTMFVLGIWGVEEGEEITGKKVELLSTPVSCSIADIGGTDVPNIRVQFDEKTST